jgi:hypothetical protein
MALLTSPGATMQVYSFPDYFPERGRKPKKRTKREEQKEKDCLNRFLWLNLPLFSFFFL